MKKNTTITPQRTDAFSITALVVMLTALLASFAVFRKLAALYTTLFEEETTPEQAVYFFYSQVLGILFFLPITNGGGWRVCIIVLFCMSTRAAMGRNFRRDD